MIKIRQELHKIPELGFREYKTKEYIKNRFIDKKCEIYEFNETGIAIYFNFQKENTICFRAELDGLPIKEINEVDYISTHDNLMHACGHDGHMAILISLIDDLIEGKYNPNNNIVFLFQPSEEIDGGAKSVIESGILEKLNVNEIYALHIWPGLQNGIIYTKKEKLLAQSIEFDIEVSGKNAHVGARFSGIDAIEIGIKLLNDIKDRVNDLEDSIVHVGKIITTGQRNIVCDNFKAKGTIRTFNNQTYTYIISQINQVINDFKEVYKTNITLKINTSTLPLINDFSLVNKTLKYGVKLLKYPYYHSEDFSLYLEHIKGVYFLLGGGNIPSLHSNNFNFDESILFNGKELFIKIMENQ